MTNSGERLENEKKPACISRVKKIYYFSPYAR